MQFFKMLSTTHVNSSKIINTEFKIWLTFDSSYAHYIYNFPLNSECNKATIKSNLRLLEWQVNSNLVLFSSIMILWLNVPSSSWIDIVSGPCGAKVMAK